MRSPVLLTSTLLFLLSGCVVDPPPDAVCGDALVEGEEACDDGNLRSGDGCDENCTATACGNGVLTDGEACDEGDGNGAVADGCREGCVLPRCGDAVRDPLAGEGCDDGNATEGDGCDTNCTPTGCGNGILTSGEACDDGADNSNTLANACRTSCVAASCGDGVADTGERCDDGNATQGNGCDTTCLPSGLLFDGTAELVCGTSQADYLLVRRPGDFDYEALNVLTGTATGINAATVSCHREQIYSNQPATFWSEPSGFRFLPGMESAWDVVPGGEWMIGLSTYLEEQPFPHLLGEFNAAGEGTPLGSYCAPYAVYTGGRGVAAYCPTEQTLEVLVWTPGAFEARTSIPVADYAGTGLYPNPYLPSGDLGTRVGLLDFGSTWLWSVPLDGSGPTVRVSQSADWAVMTADEQSLVFDTTDHTLLRHAPGAESTEVIATGLVSQLHPRAGNFSVDWFRVGRAHGWVAYSQPGPQLYISRSDDPSVSHALAVGALQPSGMPRFTDDGAYALYRLPSGLYAHPTSGGEPVLLDAFGVEYFTAGGSVVAWTRAEPSTEGTGELRVRDLASAEGHRVVAEHVYRGGTVGPVRIGAKKIAYRTSTPVEGGTLESTFVRDLY